MSLKLMYITNKPSIALVAEKSGVDRIFIDLEKLGKKERQGHINSVMSNHSIKDIKVIRNTITSSELLVRVNPINPDSENEIQSVIENGADIIMLPMWKTLDEVIVFLKYVNGRVKVNLLLETKEADEIIDEVIKLNGIDEIHIGLNDLHLSYGKTFMFELLTDGTVEKLCSKIKNAGIPYGFGGIGRIGYGKLMAEHILCEHYRLGSNMVILSRSFCNSDNEIDMSILERKFRVGIKSIRAYEDTFKHFDNEMFAENQSAVRMEVENFVMQILNK